MRIFKWILGILLGLIVVIFAGVYIYLRATKEKLPFRESPNRLKSSVTLTVCPTSMPRPMRMPILRWAIAWPRTGFFIWT